MKIQSNTMSLLIILKNWMVLSLNSERIPFNPPIPPLLREGKGGLLFLSKIIARVKTINEIEILNKKSGAAKSLLNNTPRSISVNIIWAKPRIKVPINLSINDRQFFFLKRRIYHEENKRRLTVIYEIVSNLFQALPESSKTAVCNFVIVFKLFLCFILHS